VARPRPSKRRWAIVCDGAELVVDCAHAADGVGREIEPRFGDDPAGEAARMLAEGARAALAVARPPSPETLVALARAARGASSQAVVAILDDGAASSTRALAGDLGIAAVSEVRPLLSTLALLEAGATEPWAASTRGLPDVDRGRLAGVLSGAERGAGRLTREDGGLVGWSAGTVPATPVGEPRDVAAAVAALARAHGAPAKAEPILEGVDDTAVLDVIFGPPRALSDPASKAALERIGVPAPVEELCSSPSRAAAEASRIGFPVRIALASPDLRVWDHPDLAVDGVDNAARVRDVFRQIMTLAGQRTPEARLLGVTVTATTVARALLRAELSPLPDGLVLAKLGFADPHGKASDDTTWTALPAPTSRIEQVLGRLSGRSLLLDGGAAHRRETVEAIGDLLLRLAAFVDDRREEIDRVEIAPVALLVGGGVEVREACVTVGDAFLRSLDVPASQG